MVRGSTGETGDSALINGCPEPFVPRRAGDRVAPPSRTARVREAFRLSFLCASQSCQASNEARGCAWDFAGAARPRFLPHPADWPRTDTPPPIGLVAERRQVVRQHKPTTDTLKQECSGCSGSRFPLCEKCSILGRSSTYQSARVFIESHKGVVEVAPCGVDFQAKKFEQRLRILVRELNERYALRGYPQHCPRSQEGSP
jgi:hypothetical protein